MSSEKHFSPRDWVASNGASIDPPINSQRRSKVIVANSLYQPDIEIHYLVGLSIRHIWPTNYIKISGKSTIVHQRQSFSQWFKAPEFVGAPGFWP